MAYHPYFFISVLSRSESPPGAGGCTESFASGEELEEDGDDDRRAGMVWIERKGDMCGVPVRVRVVVISPDDARGRMDQETQVTIVWKK